MKLNLPTVPTVNSISTINSNFEKIEQELQDKVLYRNNPEGEPNTLESDVDANGNNLFNVSTVRTDSLYIDGERVVPSGVIVVEGGVDPASVLYKSNNLSDVQSTATARINLGLGNVDNTSDMNKPVSTATTSALAGKQDTLVSGTNIKTLNGNSILGSGDLVLTGVGETNTTSNLGTGVGLAAAKVGVNLPFKSLIAGTNITLTSSTNDVTIDAAVNTTNLLVKSNNLSDVQSAATSRNNLGLGNVDNTSDVNKPISTATASALASKQATLVSGSNIKTINGNSILGSGDLTVAGGSTTFIAAGIGAVSRTMQDKVRDVVSVKDYGALGDGVTSDFAACQLAINAVAAAGGGAVYFPSGKYKFTSPLVLPNSNITLYGDGPSSIITGAGTLITYPSSPYNGTNVVVQNIYDLSFEQSADGVCIQMQQTWDSIGKVGPEISRCYFSHLSSSTTSAISIQITGVWAANINNCFFVGKGAGGGPTTGIGGYGIRITPGVTSSGSIMNVLIANNTFVTLAFPVYMDARSGSGGSPGLIEGIKITGNNMAAGNVAITTNQTLATTITGNQLSDYYQGMQSTNDFDMSIVGNSEITGVYSGINLVAGSGGNITERITITGNNISGAAGVGVRLSNVTADDVLRNIIISNNSFRGVPGATVGYGISFEGSKTINGIAMIGNTFEWLSSGYWFSGNAHSRNLLLGNTYSSVTTEITNFQYSGSNGGQLTGYTNLSGDSRFIVQMGADGTSSTPTITFPIPFKAGTTPVVLMQAIGTGNTTLEAPGISVLSNTTLQIQKKQLSGGSIILSNYTVGWVAIGVAQ